MVDGSQLSESLLTLACKAAYLPGPLLWAGSNLLARTACDLLLPVRRWKNGQSRNSEDAHEWIEHFIKNTNLGLHF